MPKLHLDWSDGRYYTRLLTDAEAAKKEAAGGDVFHLEDAVYAAYSRDCERDAIWQAFWHAIANEQYMRRRESELRPLEDAEREIARLKEELERAERMSKHHEDASMRLRRAVRGHARESRNWTCVFPTPGCHVDFLPPAWHARAGEILAKYNPALAAEGMQAQGCCCGHDHQHLHEATVTQLRRAGFLVEHDSDEPEYNEYNEYTHVYPQPGCDVRALPSEWVVLAQEILAKFKLQHMEGGQKYGCLVENDTESL